MRIVTFGSNAWLEVIGLVLGFIIFYSIKLIITSKSNSKGIAIVSYVALCIIALLIPSFSGNHKINVIDVFDIHTIILIFSIPTVTFAIDIFSGKKRSLRFLIVRSLFEILLVPVWFVICILIFVHLGMMATN